MSRHLLLIVLGPVQEFIAQARRTRDLWYGSHLLSELGRCAARTLVEGGADLIFPALERGDRELVACPSPLRPDGAPPINIANKLLAEVPAECEPGLLARKVREGLKSFWLSQIAGRVKSSCAGLLDRGIDQAWLEQLETFLDFTAAWKPFSDADYPAARRALEREVASRKMLREFDSWKCLRGSVSKSSLDGGRETVLRPPAQRDAQLAARYRIAAGEELDAIGLIKRAGGEPEQFVPIFNVAFGPWLQLAEAHAGAQLSALGRAASKLGLSRVVRKVACVSPFGFDAGVLLASRWKSIFQELGSTVDPNDWGREHVGPLLEVLQEPYPYVACLVADGDGMGAVLGKLQSPSAHRDFSRVLSAFGREARRVVEDEHRGSLIYAGGDDVLAFLPLSDALACGDSLRRCFSTMLGPLNLEPPPTLSVGLGIGHVMEGMGDLLELGREAEKLAKGADLAREQARNALGVIVDKRSGGRASLRMRWDQNPVDQLKQDLALLETRLPARKVHEVGRLADRLPTPSSHLDSAWKVVLEMEIRRLLARSDSGEKALAPRDVGLHAKPLATYEERFAELQSWVSRMLVARVVASAIPRLRPTRKALP